MTTAAARALSLATFLAVAGCGDASSRPVAVITADPVGTALDLVIAACNPTDLRVEVEEPDGMVTLRATVQQQATGDDCASVRQVDLRAPLGDRQVVDADTAEPIPTTGG